MLNTALTMSKIALSGSFLAIVTSVIFAFAMFLSKTMFDDARALATEFRLHQVTANQKIQQLENTDALLSERMQYMEKTLLEIKTDVKQLLKR